LSWESGESKFLGFNVRAQYLPNQIEGRARSSCCESLSQKNPGFVCRGVWHLNPSRGRQFEYAPEKLKAGAPSGPESQNIAVEMSVLM
jgi:hypothetical protein